MSRSERREATVVLDAEYDALDATPVVADTESLMPVLGADGRGVTVASEWAALDAEGRREFLRSDEFSIRFGSADGTERAELDGYGVWVDSLDTGDYEPTDTEIAAWARDTRTQPESE
jgi:hypothetical protein